MKFRFNNLNEEIFLDIFGIMPQDLTEKYLMEHKSNLKGKYDSNWSKLAPNEIGGIL